MALGLGVLVLGFRLGWQDYWWDEDDTLMFTRLGWRELMVDYWGLDTHRPFYYALQKAWIDLFGESIVAVRALPVLLALLTVPVLFRIAREIEIGPLAAVTVLLVISAPMFVHYGREVRMYSLLTLCLSMAVLYALRLARQAQAGTVKTGAIVLFAMSLAAAFYAQALTIIAAVIFALWGLFILLSGIVPKWFLTVLVKSSVLYIVLILPALFPFFQHLDSTLGEGFWIPEPTFSHLYTEMKATYAYPNVTKIGALVLLVLGFWSLRSRPLAFSLLVMVVIGFPTLVFLVSLYKPVFLSRVIAWTSVIAIIVMAAGALSLPGHWKWAAVLFLVAAQAGNLARYYPAEREESVYAAFAPVLKDFDPERMVLVLATQRLEPALHWYYPDLQWQSVFGFREGDRIVDVFHPIYRSTFVPRSEAQSIPQQGKVLIVLRRIQKSKFIDDEDRVDSAVVTVISERKVTNSIITDDLRLDVFPAP